MLLKKKKYCEVFYFFKKVCLNVSGDRIGKVCHAILRSCVAILNIVYVGGGWTGNRSDDNISLEPGWK